MKTCVLLILSITTVALRMHGMVGSANISADRYAVAGGESYSITASCTWDEDLYCDLYLLRDGEYFDSTGGWSDLSGGYGYVEFTRSFADRGTRSIAYQALGVEGWTGSTLTSFPLIITVSEPPVGSFETVSSVAKGQNITAAGWAVSYHMGAPVAHVDFYLDGTYSGRATIGGSRPDVQSANATSTFWSPKDVTPSGWSISYSTSGLTVGSHTLRVLIWDDKGQSTDTGTKTFTITQSPQAISFSNPGQQIYGTPVVLTASASSGLPVSYSVSGPAYLSGNTLYFTAPGTVTVTASQSGNGDYSAAANVTQTFPVNPLSQSITFHNPGAQSYGTPLTLNASASSGLNVIYSASGPATISGNTVYFNGVGQVVVTASQPGNAYYSAAADLAQSFTVNRQSTSFSVANTSFTYDGQNHGPTISSNPGGASYIVAGTTTAVHAGSYSTAVTATGNYVGSANFSWSIHQQGQSVTFANPGRQTYGTPLRLTATASSGLAVSFSVSGPASLAGDMLTFTGTGSVTITASQGGNQDYSAANSVTQTFIVDPQAVTFSLNATSFTYNGFSQGPVVISNPSGATFSLSGPSSATNVASYTITASGTGNYIGSSNLTWHIAPTSQSIAFNQPPDQTYGDSLRLGATASSGLPVSYGVANGPATVADDVVTFTGCGAVTIVASQAGNSNFSSAADIVRTITVRPKAATFALSGTSFGYNGSTQGPSVVATPNDATYSVTGPIAAANGGTYSVTINATGNYSGSNSLTWTINKAPQTIAFLNPGTQRAGTSITLAATTTSGLPLAWSASGPVSLSGNIATFTKGGAATITASQPGDVNYAAAVDVVATFTVTRDPNADDDGDGIANGTEELLGTDPNSAAPVDGQNANQLKINTPSK